MTSLPPSSTLFPYTTLFRSVALESGIPVIFEVLATEDLRQAMDRVGGGHGNKGRDAAIAALEMASLLDALPKEEERSEEHTSELQSPDHLVCRLLLVKKKSQ